MVGCQGSWGGGRIFCFVFWIPENLTFGVPGFLGTPGKPQYGVSLSISGQYNVYLKTSTNTWGHLVDSVHWPVVSLALDHPIVPLSPFLDVPIIPMSPSQDDPIIPVHPSLPLPAQLGGDGTDLAPPQLLSARKSLNLKVLPNFLYYSNIERVWILDL